jgi:hypothetical protein
MVCVKYSPKGVPLVTYIQAEMPVLIRHEGDWIGTYIVVDLQGKILDRHESHLTCEFPLNGAFPDYQTNRYTWADGKKEEPEEFVNIPCVRQGSCQIIVTRSWERFGGNENFERRSCVYFGNTFFCVF